MAITTEEPIRTVGARELFLPGNYGEAAPIFGPFRKRTLRLTFLGVLIGIQLFFYLATLFSQTFLPGNWTVLSPDFLYYLLLDVLALFLMGGFRYQNKVIQPAGAGGFLITFPLWATITFLLMTIAFASTVSTVTPLTLTEKIMDLVLYGIFVAPTEELLFRVALPPVLSGYGGWVTAQIIFAGFHFLELTATGQGIVGPVIDQAVEIFGLGLLLYAVFHYFGYGAAVGFHFAWDATIAGALGVGVFAGFHLGLVPF